MLRLLIIFVMISGCKKAKEVEPNPFLQTSLLFEMFQANLMENFRSDLSFVIAKNEVGEAIDQGDSLLFTGLAMGVVSCENVSKFILAFEEMLNAYDGYLVRFNPIPPSYISKKDMVSRDGAVGALFGFIRAQERCPQFRGEIDGMLIRWLSTVGNSLYLHPQGLNGVITPSFRSFLDASMGKGLSQAEYVLFMASNFVTVKGIVANKQACYPIHLETLQFLVLEMRDIYLEKADKVEWCKLTSGNGLLLTDWYCDVNTDIIKLWLTNPQKSPHIYTHQRCSWESGDLNGGKSPRVDFLLLYQLFNEGSSPW